MNNERVRGEFIKFMKEKGLGPSNTDAIVADGKLHRYHVVGDKRSRKNGWYVLFADNLPAGACGSHRLGKKYKWCSKDRSSLTEAEARRFKQRDEEIQRVRDDERVGQNLDAKKNALRAWKTAKPANGDHPYLKRKKVRAYGLRQRGAELIVPLRDAAGKLWSSQTIRPNGSKSYFTGARKRGCFHLIGGPIQFEVIIAEGYATAATCHRVKKMPCAMACDASNLMDVAKAIRTAHPLAEIYLAADDDLPVERDSGTNPGIEAARAAAAAVNGRLAIPRFAKREGKEVTDFNDLMRLEGKTAVRRCFSDARTVVPSDGAEAFAMNVRDFLRLPITPRKLVVSPWLPEAGLAIIHGAPGSGKSLIRDALAAHLMAGTNFLRWSIAAPASVLIVDGDMPKADVHERISVALKSLGEKPKAPMRILAGDTVKGCIDLSDAKWRQTIEREAAGSMVILLDNVATLMGDGDMNDARAWLGVQRWMVEMRAKGHAIVWFHHDGKNGTQLGTMAKEIVLDARIQLTNAGRKKINGTTFKVVYRKTRNFYGASAAPFSVQVEMSPKGRQRWTCPEPDRKKQVEVRNLRKAGKSEREIAEITNVPKSTVNRWLKKVSSSVQKE